MALSRVKINGSARGIESFYGKMNGSKVQLLPIYAKVGGASRMITGQKYTAVRYVWNKYAATAQETDIYVWDSWSPAIITTNKYKFFELDGITVRTDPVYTYGALSVSPISYPLGDSGFTKYPFTKYSGTFPMAVKGPSYNGELYSTLRSAYPDGCAAALPVRSGETGTRH